MEQARREEIVSAVSPYRELFGVDASSRGRKTAEVEVMAPFPDLALVPDRKQAHRLTMKIHFRTLQVLKHLYVDDFRSIFEKEMALELERVAEEERAGLEAEKSVAPVLKRRRKARQ